MNLFIDDKVGKGKFEFSIIVDQLMTYDLSLFVLGCDILTKLSAKV